MTRDADTDKYKYQAHGIGFDLSGIFSYPDEGDGKNVIIFGVDMTKTCLKRCLRFRSWSYTKNR